MKKSPLIGAACLFLVSMFTVIGSAQADIVTFGFTGRLTVFDPNGGVISDPSSTGAITGTNGAQVAINSQLTFDTNNALGTADLVIAPFDFLAGGGAPNTTFHNISMQSVGGSLFVVNMLADFIATNDIPVSMVWDAAGMLGAFSLAPGGLQPGDVISGDVLTRAGQVIAPSVGSANPATNGTFNIGVGSTITLDQGLAPIAVTTFDTLSTCVPAFPGDCLGTTGAYTIVGDDGTPGSPMIDGPFPGISVAIDIGSGNSMTVLSVTSVPVPAAFWLFGSGLLGLVGMARHKKRS